MGGFFDLLALLLGWKSAPAEARPPYRAAAGRVWHAGAEAARPLVPGTEAGAAFTPGATAGRTHA
jgi:hypothetical protein